MVSSKKSTPGQLRTCSKADHRSHDHCAERRTCYEPERSRTDRAAVDRPRRVAPFFTGAPFFRRLVYWADTCFRGFRVDCPGGIPLPLLSLQGDLSLIVLWCSLSDYGFRAPRSVTSMLRCRHGFQAYRRALSFQSACYFAICKRSLYAAWSNFPPPTFPFVGTSTFGRGLAGRWFPLRPIRQRETVGREFLPATRYQTASERGCLWIGAWVLLVHDAHPGVPYGCDLKER